MSETRLLLIVSKDHADRLDAFRHEFAADKLIEVVLDRRAGERRSRKVKPKTERREQERRQEHVERDLQAKGWALALKLP